MKRLLILCSTLLLFFVHTLHAQTIRYVSEGGSGTRDGSSWSNASGDPQAIINAVSAAGGGEVWVAQGTYKPTSSTDRTISFAMKNDVGIYGGFSGNGTETARSQRNWTTNVTILSGDIGTSGNNSDNSYHVIYNNNNGLNNTAILDGFTITAGNANGSSSPNNSGGGMYNASSSPTLTNCSFAGNNATFGGGMGNRSSSPTLTNCSFSGNSATYGGGMRNTAYSSPTLTNCSFAGNSVSYYGGGMLNESSSPVLTNCSFSGNSASYYGGGIYNRSSSPMLTNCSFAGNRATYYAGGIYNDGSPSTLTNCSLTGNSANIGGGIYNYSISPTLTNCILWGDTGGEIFNDFSNPSVIYSIVQGGYSGTGNKNQDPLFVDAANGDLHLRPCSPAIDAGNDAANTTTTDLDGNSRKVRTIDMGAYEYQGTVAPTVNTQPQPTQSVCQNNSATTLTVEASGAGITYQWYSNESNSNTGGTAINSATTASYTPPTTTAGTQYYYVEVSNTCGTKVTSNVAAVTVNVCICSNATNLTTTNITSSSARLNWVASVNPVQWQLRYKSTAAGSKWIDVPVAASARSVTINGLKARQDYNWHIRAKCGKAWTEYSITINFKTLLVEQTVAKAVQIENAVLETNTELEVKVSPVPSSVHFNLNIRSNNHKDRIFLRVVDAFGRVIEQTQNLTLGQIHRFGGEYRPGVYLIEVQQGAQKQTLKVIKQ